MEVVGPEDVREVSDEELTRRVVERQRHIDQQRAVQAVELAEWRNRGLWATDGSRTAASHFARETGVSTPTAKRLFYRGRRLLNMPHTLEAWRRGELCESRVDLLLRANLPRLFDVFERDEGMLVFQLKTLSWTDAVKAIEYWMLHADEVGTKERKKQLVEQRSASLSKSFEGSLDVKALFDPISGAIFNNEAKRLYDQLFEADWAEARELLGDKVTVDDLKRTPAQRRHDALVEMAKRSAAMAPGSRFTRPLFNVVVGRTGFEKVCELAEGTVLSPDQLVPYLSEAAIERIVFDGPSRVIDLGQQRLFKGALRRVLEIRDGHCQHPSGCDVPASRCEGDHTTAYIKGGKTNQFNGKCMCGFHNRSKGSGPPDGKAA